MKRISIAALALVIGALVLAGCGGSSKKSPSSSGGTGTSGGTTSSSLLSPSIPVSSTTYKTTLASKLAEIPGLPAGIMGRSNYFGNLGANGWAYDQLNNAVPKNMGQAGVFAYGSSTRLDDITDGKMGDVLLQAGDTIKVDQRVF